MLSSLSITLTASNIQNRLKTWRIRYLTVKDMISLSNFGLDPPTNQLKADDSVWADYVKAHPEVAKYRGVNLTNWDEIAIIVGTEQETGTTPMGAGQAEADINAPATPVADACNQEGDDDNDTPPPTSRPSSPVNSQKTAGANKPKRNDASSSMNEIASSFKSIADNLSER